MNSARAKLKPSAGVRLLPSAVTVLAMCVGLSAIKFSLDGRLNTAVAMIGAAAVLDGLDGRIARMLDATSAMGAELDSLADAINFGVAPAIVLYVSMLEGSNGGWIIALLYAVSIVLRLARFNTLLDDASLPAYTKDFFVGVPAPAGALIALTPIAALLQVGHNGWWNSFYLVCGWMIFTSALIVSRIPTMAFKSLSVPPRMAAALLVLVALAAAALVTFPYILMIVLVAVYLLHIPFAIHSQRWIAARPEIWDYKPSERRAERRAIRRAPSNRRSVARLGLRRPRG
ncbi:MAG: CDP-alcohol phosphatidyltransferase family protein [Mycobacteriaceae bacterium]